jgi:hypothetical protein
MSKPLVEYIIEKSEKRERVLLLSEPGQGKSTLMQRVFILMADRFITNKSRLIPIYIPCRQLSLPGEGAISVKEILDSLSSEGNPFPLSIKDINKGYRHRVVLVFDGLDEVGGTIKQTLVHRRTDSDVFSLPVIVSCRMNFYQSYLSDLDNKLTRGIEKVELRPLNVTLVNDYINANCKITGHQDLAGNVIQAIDQNRDLSDLSRTFLSLVMMIDLFSDEKVKADQAWSVTKLYEEYSRKWLAQEALKWKGLDWNQKSVIMEKIAWEIHTNKLPSTLAYGDNIFLTISRFELENLLGDLTRKLDLPIPEILSDVCYRTFLGNEGENFHFLHRSFQEFYIAKFIYRSITLSVSDAERALKEFLPVEIASFLKDMVNASNEVLVEQITDNLIQVYRSQKNEDSPDSVTAREHACYYLGRLKSKRIESFLEESIPNEKREWIRRGMIIDLIYTYKQRRKLSEYLKELKNNPIVDSVNRGYHLEYYGDQAPEGDHTDKGGAKCDRTVRAIVRHIKNPIRHEVGWALDIYTLRRLIETRTKLMDIRNIIPANEAAVLKEFLNKAHALDPELEREVRQLCRLMNKENIL